MSAINHDSRFICRSVSTVYQAVRAAIVLAATTTLLNSPMPISAQDGPPPSGLVGWWRGEGNGNDSADGHDGTLLNGVKFEPGVFGQAFSFAGTANRVYVPDSEDLKLATSLSIGVWIYPKASSWHVVERSGNRGSSVAYSLGMDNAGHLLFVVNSTNAHAELTAPVSYNQWQQVTATLDDAAGNMALYVDGVLVAQQSTNVRPLRDIDPAQAPGLGIGNTPVLGTFPFVGLVDEVLLYSRALTPTEVALLASTNSPPTILVQPQAQLAFWGTSISLNVSAQGTPPLHYLWYKDGAALTWATNASLVLTNLSIDDQGNYVVVVSNPFGIIVSSNALVMVNPANVTLGLYPGLTISGITGKSFAIQYTTNLDAGGAWTTLTNLTLMEPTQLWIDAEANVSSGSAPRRFYRVVALP